MICLPLLCYTLYDGWLPRNNSTMSMLLCWAEFETRLSGAGAQWRRTFFFLLPLPPAFAAESNDAHQTSRSPKPEDGKTSIDGCASCALMPLTQLMVHWCLSALVIEKRMPLCSRLIALPYFSRGSLCIPASAWESLIGWRWCDLWSGSSAHQLCAGDQRASEWKAHNSSLCFCAPYFTASL